MAAPDPIYLDCRRLVALLSFVASPLFGQATPALDPAKARARECSQCAEWMIPQEPFRVYGNTYYVGTHGLSAILITSPAGDILIDGALPEAAPVIADHIAALGFRIGDVKVILNSHAHSDHAGGIATLARMSGATVMASPWSATTLEHGFSDSQDPQFGSVLPFPAVGLVKRIKDGDTVRVRDLAAVAHFTAGHTPGGTTWTWQSCEASKCLSMVYADSQTPVSADSFYFSRSKSYPTAVADFRHGLAVLESLPCDILLTPHPSASKLGTQLDASPRTSSALIDPGACKTLAADSRAQLDRRLAAEKRP